MYEESLLALFYLLGAKDGELESPGMFYGRSLEEEETAELVAFVRMASLELERRGAECPERKALVRKAVGAAKIRITRNLRIYVGMQEVTARPMTKCVLLLFLKHPEGIVLKSINDYAAELCLLYRKLSRSDNPLAIENRVQKLLDICSNNLNTNISRANAAMAALVDEPELYTIKGSAGQPKRIRISRSMIIWE